MNKDDILKEAKERFELSLERSSHNREKAKSDIRFAAASPDDPWQWDDLSIQQRKLHMRPMLTINKLPQHIRQVTNDIRQNRPAIRYRPADSDADVEVADILMGIARHIEARSDADVAYDTASEHQVVHGLGYIRVMSDYVSESSFDQDMLIVRVKDPFKCHDDPDAEDPAGADRKWFFIEDELDEADFKAQYPKADPIDWTFASDGAWFSGDKKVRVVEYFSVEDKKATLNLWADGSTTWDKELPADPMVAGTKPVKTRESCKRSVMWRKLNGQEILEEREFPCKYIPVARVIGNEWQVDGKTYLSGLVRNAKDSQRMYNVAQSAIVERVMQAPKSPWAAPAEAIEGYESIWQTANTANHSYLPYNHVDAEGNPIPAPVRVSPTTVEAGLNQIAMGASDDLKSETGQYDASLGQRSNETSGRAIMARQREGDNATFHYIDNLGRGIRHVGRIILDMIPKIYDTKRIARILGEDGEQSNVTIDPDHPQAYSEVRDDQGEIQRIFNPSIGEYDVYTTSGPSFTTRRMEAVDAMTAMTQANPMLWQVIGDQLVKSMDWPGAEEMAKRLKVTLLPAVQQSIAKEDEGQVEIPPQVQQELQQMHQTVQQLDSTIQAMDAEMQKKDAAVQAAETRVAQETTKRLKLEIDLDRVNAMNAIEEQREQAIDAIQQAQAVEPEPVDEGPGIGEQLASVLGPVMQGFAEAVNQTGQQVAQIAEGQQIIMQEIARGNDQTNALIAKASEPKTAQIRVIKQADGSFVGEKVEQ